MSRAVLLDRTHRHEEAIADISTAIEILELELALALKSKSVTHSPVQLSKMRGGGRGGRGEGGEEEGEEKITITIKANRAVEENKKKTLLKFSREYQLMRRKWLRKETRKRGIRPVENISSTFLRTEHLSFLKHSGIQKRFQICLPLLKSAKTINTVKWLFTDSKLIL